MCDVGGPRCPKHAGEDLSKAKQALGEVLSARQTGDASEADVEEAHSNLKRAQLGWDSTHPGMNDLAEQLERPESENRAGIKGRLEAGFAKRYAEYTARAEREGNHRVYMLVDSSIETEPKLPAKGIYVPEDSRLPISYEVDSAVFSGRFYKGLKTTKATSLYGAQVDLVPRKDLKGMRLFTTRDGQSGLAMAEDGYVTGVFTTSSKYRKTAVSHLKHASSLGANRLDCFNTFLPGIYKKAGYKTHAAVPFNDDYAPDGWKRSTYREWNGGRPDVVFMANAGHIPEPDAPKRFSDYDDAYTYIYSLVRKEES